MDNREQELDDKRFVSVAFLLLNLRLLPEMPVASRF